MTTQIRPFRPLAATQNTAVTGTAQTVTLNYNLGTHQIRFCNIGTQTVFVLFGESTQTAATVSNAIPITAGATEIFTISSDVLTYSVIAGDTGSTLYSTIGEGL
jgi:hypothetical protein